MRNVLVVGLFSLIVLMDAAPVLAVVKGGDLPKETCARRETNGTLTTGSCDTVCKDKTLYEPDTDAEVDAISSNGGVCNAAKVGILNGLKFNTQGLTLSTKP